MKYFREVVENGKYVQLIHLIIHGYWNNLFSLMVVLNSNNATYVSHAFLKLSDYFGIRFEIYLVS